MIIHMLQDPGPLPMEPIRIVDVSPFHSSNFPVRDGHKLGRWVPWERLASIGAGLRRFAAVGASGTTAAELAHGDADVSAAWTPLPLRLESDGTAA